MKLVDPIPKSPPFILILFSLHHSQHPAPNLKYLPLQKPLFFSNTRLSFIYLSFFVHCWIGRMKFSIVQTRRLLLQANTETTTTTLHSTMSSSDPTFQPMNDSVASAMSRPFKLTAPFDSSMALTILVLLTALFFMAFFSIYIRHFTADVTPEDRRRRNPSPPSTSGHSSCRKGVDPAVVKSLPLVSYRGPVEHLIEDCPICLTEFEASELVKLLPYCRHVFHQQCLDTWLDSHVSCPLCRSTQFFKKADEVCLDVNEVENGRSTVQECDTCRNIRRSCSYSNLGNRVALHRSASF